MEPFGRYILERRIAEGGMGEIFLAHQPGIAGFEKKLVVKRIKPALMGDKAFVEMFLNEGRVAALIDHPNVVHIYELGQESGAYFISMEFVPGKSLATVMERLGGAMELRHALHVMLNVCQGLGYAHDAVDNKGQPLHLVHRDVSPPNILIGYSGTVKILDFGIAKVEHHQQTAAGVLKGRFAYLSPEQARGESVDKRTDIFALGLILFEMTVGRRANPGNTDSAMVFAAANRKLPDPRELVPDYPEELQQVFLKATALEVDARYQRVQDLQDDLQAFQLDRRLVVSSGAVGEWVRSLGGEELIEEPAHEASTVPSRAREAEGRDGPKIAYAPTVHQQQVDDKKKPSLTDLLPSFDAAPPVGASPAASLTDQLPSFENAPAVDAAPPAAGRAGDTPRARRKSHPAILEVDLEKERDPELVLREDDDLELVRGRGPLRALIIGVLLVGAALAGGLYLMHLRASKPPAVTPDASVKQRPSQPAAVRPVDRGLPADQSVLDSRAVVPAKAGKPAAPAAKTAPRRPDARAPDRAAPAPAAGQPDLTVWPSPAPAAPEDAGK